MTYAEVAETIQRWMNWNGIIQGSIEQQIRMAESPCNEVLKECGVSDRLYLIYSIDEGVFYDIFAEVEGVVIRIGHFSNNNTSCRQAIKVNFRQAIKVYFQHLDLYGAEDFDIALHKMARESVSKKSSAITAKIKKLEETMKAEIAHLERTQATIERLDADITRMCGK